MSQNLTPGAAGKQGRKFYHPTAEGGIRFSSERKAGYVQIPNYVCDMWTPILGVAALGVYVNYARLEREGSVKAITLDDLAAAFRVGKKTLMDINDKLADCGFIRVDRPTGHKRLMHWTTNIAVLDPPQEVSAQLIEKYGPKRYEVLSPWLCATEVLDRTSGSSTQTRPEVPDGTSKIESLGIETLERIEEESASPAASASSSPLSFDSSSGSSRIATRSTDEPNAPKKEGQSSSASPDNKAETEADAPSSSAKPSESKKAKQGDKTPTPPTPSSPKAVLSGQTAPTALEERYLDIWNVRMLPASKAKLNERTVVSGRGAISLNEAYDESEAVRDWWGENQYPFATSDRCQSIDHAVNTAVRDFRMEAPKLFLQQRIRDDAYAEQERLERAAAERKAEEARKRKAQREQRAIETAELDARLGLPPNWRDGISYDERGVPMPAGVYGGYYDEQGARCQALEEMGYEQIEAQHVADWSFRLPARAGAPDWFGAESKAPLHSAAKALLATLPEGFGIRGAITLAAATDRPELYQATFDEIKLRQEYDRAVFAPLLADDDDPELPRLRARVAELEAASERAKARVEQLKQARALKAAA